MAKYINKNALVAEVVARYDECLKRAKIIDAEYWNGKADAYRDMLVVLGSPKIKEVDLENGMVCKVDWYDGFFLAYTQEQQDELLEKIGANVGDKIRVILIKE